MRSYSNGFMPETMPWHFPLFGRRREIKLKG